jgi:hypothetical protein
MRLVAVRTNAERAGLGIAPPTTCWTTSKATYGARIKNWTEHHRAEAQRTDLHAGAVEGPVLHARRRDRVPGPAVEHVEPADRQPLDLELGDLHVPDDRPADRQPGDGERSVARGAAAAAPRASAPASSIPLIGSHGNIAQ